jgi:peptidoglycan/xylan/chitin deacetylase (PgdA/CDA1 family)
MYHYIRINPVASDLAGFNLSVTPTDFADQMAYLARNDFTTVTMAQVRAYVRDGTPLPPRAIALTFDDGYDDAYSAARPVLEQYHMTATFYIITGFLDTPRYLTWDQVVALDREGMEIGSHTVHHPALPTLGLALRRFEIASSRAGLEQHLGHPVLDFCYPGGELSAAVEATVKESGYLSATTTESGRARRGDDPLRLPRLRIWGGETLSQFVRVLGLPFAAAGPAATSPSRVVPLAPTRIVPTPAGRLRAIASPRSAKSIRKRTSPTPSPTPSPLRGGSHPAAGRPAAGGGG